MFKTKEELQKLKKEIAIQDGFIHDLYGSLIRHLNREIGDYSVTEKDEDSNAELRKKCFFLEIEIRDRERKKEKEEAKVIDRAGDITKERREKFNDAQVGWGTRKIIETHNSKGERMKALLIRPQDFIRICGVEFNISGESLETIITEAIRLKLDVYKKGEHGLTKCPAGLYEILGI